MIGWTTLEGGARVFIVSDEKQKKCRSCETVILWGRTEGGSPMPVERVIEQGQVKYYSHFARYKDADKFRKGRRQ